MLKRFMLELRYRYVMCGAFLLGLMAHGFMLTNKIAFHDDVSSLHSIGYTWKLGRWGLGIIQLLLENTIGKYSMPLFEGVISLLFIAISACLIVDLLNIQDSKLCFCLGGIMAVLPVVAGTFQYMFTSSAYFFGLFLTLFALWSTERYKYGVGIAVFCIALSLGIYQPYFCVGITVCILLFFVKLKTENLKQFLSDGVKHVLAQVVGLIGYFIGVKLSLFVLGLKLAKYQGANTMMDIALWERIKRLKICYEEFFGIFTRNIAGMTGNLFSRIILIVLLCIWGIGMLLYLRQLDSMWEKAICVLLIIIFPIGMNLIYPMTLEESNVYVLMRYSLIGFWLAPFSIINIIEINNCGIRKILSNIVLGCGILSIFMYIYLDNSLYLKLHFLQEQTTAYYTTLITQIKSCDEYKDEYPVCFIGWGNIEDKTFMVNDKYRLEGMGVGEQDLCDWVNSAVYSVYMSNHCGYNPTIIRADEIDCVDKVELMPIYPDDGAIQVIDGIVIIKMAELELSDMN